MKSTISRLILMAGAIVTLSLAACIALPAGPSGGRSTGSSGGSFAGDPVVGDQATCGSSDVSCPQSFVEVLPSAPTFQGSCGENLSSV